MTNPGPLQSNTARSRPAFRWPSSPSSTRSVRSSRPRSPTCPRSSPPPASERSAQAIAKTPAERPGFFDSGACTCEALSSRRSIRRRSALFVPAHDPAGEPRLCGSCARRDRVSVQRELLHPQIAEFADQETVLGAAVDGVDEVELLRQPTRPAELSDHRSVQLQLVDLAADVDVVWRIRIRAVEDLIRARRYAKRLRRTDIGDLRLEGPVVVEHLDALVLGI